MRDQLTLEVPLDDPAYELLAASAGGLYEWQQPALPEDLCLLRATGEPWLVTIAHEEDGNVNLAPGELAVLRQEVPSVAAALRPDDPPASA